MGGSVLFQDALQARLDLIKPSKQSFVDCLKERPATLSDGARDGVWDVWGARVSTRPPIYTYFIQPINSAPPPQNKQINQAWRSSSASCSSAGRPSTLSRAGSVWCVCAFGLRGRYVFD